MILIFHVNISQRVAFTSEETMERLNNELYDFLMKSGKQEDMTRLSNLIMNYAQKWCEGLDSEIAHDALSFVQDQIHIKHKLANAWPPVKKAIDNFIKNAKRPSKKGTLYIPAGEVTEDQTGYIAKWAIRAEFPKVAIWQMPEGRKKRIHEFYWLDGMNEKEIAKVEGISQQAVSKTLKDSMPKTKCIAPKYRHRWVAHFDYSECSLCGMKVYRARPVRKKYMPHDEANIEIMVDTEPTWEDENEEFTP